MSTGYGWRRDAEIEREARTAVAGLKTPARETARFSLVEVFELDRLVRLEIREITSDSEPQITLMLGLDQAAKLSAVLAKCVERLDARATRENWARKRSLLP